MFRGIPRERGVQTLNFRERERERGRDRERERERQRERERERVCERERERESESVRVSAGRREIARVMMLDSGGTDVSMREDSV